MIIRSGELGTAIRDELVRFGEARNLCILRWPFDRDPHKYLMKAYSSMLTKSALISNKG